MLSSRHMYVQFIDDSQGLTLAAASTLSVDGLSTNVQGARNLGVHAGKAAIDKGIRKVVVDRGGFTFHGRVKAIVEGVMEAGLLISVKETAAPADEAAVVEEKK